MSAERFIFQIIYLSYNWENVHLKTSTAAVGLPEARIFKVYHCSTKYGLLKAAFFIPHADMKS